MQDPFEQLDKEFSRKVLSKFQSEENYVRALVDVFSKNEKYALILGASLSTLFKNLHKGKWKNKDSIKVDFFNCVKAYTEPFSFDPIVETAKEKVAFDLYIIALQIVSRLELVDGIGIDFRNFDEKNDNLHLVIKTSRLGVTEEGNDFTLDGKFFDSLPDKLNPEEPEYKDKLLDVCDTFMEELEEY